VRARNPPIIAGGCSCSEVFVDLFLDIAVVIATLGEADSLGEFAEGF
jgi:hypothetical protein